ncbi:MAG: glycosyltransferase family 4 protein [Actinomycetota bacterium]
MRILVCSAGRPDATTPASTLASALGDAGDEVHLVVPETGDARLPSVRSGNVTVSGAGEYPPLIPEDDGVSRALQVNLSVLDRATIALTSQPFDVIHAYGAEIVYAAGALARLFDIPVVATVRPSVRRAQSIAPHWTAWLATEAARLVVSSSDAAERLSQTLGIPEQKIAVVRPSRAATPEQRARSLATRARAVYESAVAEHAARSRARRTPGTRRGARTRLGSAPAAR